MSEETKVVETTDTTTEIAETTSVERQEIEISEPVTSQQMTNTNSSVQTNSKSKKFVIGSPKDNTSTSQENIEEVESHTDNKHNEQKIRSDEEDDYVNITKQVSAIPDQVNSEPQQQPTQPTQQPTPKEEKDTNPLESPKPTTSSTEAHQAAPVITNSTVTATTQQQLAPPKQQQPKFILNTPAESPDSTPISSPPDKVHVINPSLKLPNLSDQSPIQPNDSYTFSPTIEDSYTNEPLNYSPSSSGMSRTQQKLLLQRQHFLADDENYLIHPRNQLRLTKVIERINREHAAISLYKDPINESLQRVWPKYVQYHPEVMEDDFGVGYEDPKEWGVGSDDKSMDHIGSASIMSGETLGVNSMMALRGIK